MCDVVVNWAGEGSLEQLHKKLKKNQLAPSPPSATSINTFLIDGERQMGQSGGQIIWGQKNMGKEETGEELTILNKLLKD